MRRSSLLMSTLALGALLLQACDAPVAPGSPRGAGRIDKPTAATLDPGTCAFGQTFTLESTNEYFPLEVGSRWTLAGEEDGALIEVRIRVLNKTETIGGVVTRVVEEVEREDGELVEVSRNFFAETADGTVCYFGEDVDIYEDGKIVSHEGAWRADAPGNFPGIIMPADPASGMSFLVEGAPGVAEDFAKIVGGGGVEVPAGSFDETIHIKDTNLLTGETGTKVYARFVGLIVDGPISLVSYRVE